MVPTLQLADEVRWADEISLQVGAADWHLDEGYVFPVETGDGAPAGFVFVGAGTAGAKFAEHGEAVAFAVAMAAGSTRDDDLALARRAVDEHRWLGAFDTALVLGDAPAPANFVRDLPVVTEAKDGVVYVDTPPERYDVFVTAHRIGPARTRAEGVLTRRLERLEQAGVDPRTAMRLDAADPDAPRRWVAEIHTEQRWLPLLEPASPNLQDEWLSLAHDPTHAIDDRYVDTLFVHGLHDRIEGRPEPRFRVLTGVPAAVELGARLAGATVNLSVAPTPNGTELSIGVESRLSIVTDRPTRIVTLAFPREHDPARWDGYLAGGDHARIVSITTADGEPLTPLGAVFGPRRPGADWLADTWLLPEPLAPGDTATVDVVVADRWPASHPLRVHQWATTTLSRAMIPYNPECALSGFPEIAELGAVAESRAVVPRSLVGPAQIPVDLRVVTPPEWAVAAPDVVERDLPAGDGLLTRARTTGSARVSLARGGVDEVAPVGPFPGVRVLRSGRPADGPYAPLVRAVLNFYRTGLPPFPDREVAVVMGPQAPRLAVHHVIEKGCFEYDVGGTVTPSLANVGAATRRAIQREVPRELGRVPVDRDDVWVGPAPGQIVVAGIREFGQEVGGAAAATRSSQPNLVERGVAHALAWQWFGRLELASRDGWIAPAAAAWLRDRFVAAAMAPEDVARWREQARQDLSDLIDDRNTRILPLTEPEPYRGEAGAQVFAALADRVGEDDVLRGLEAFLLGDEHTTAALERAISAAAGEDLGPFFDLFVRGGVRPEITGTWRVVRGDVHLTLTSDVPIGRFEVPVGVVTKNGVRRGRVTLVDGRGEVTLPVKGTPLRVEIDPDQVMPLRKRSLGRAGQPDGNGGRPDAADPRRLAPDAAHSSALATAGERTG